MNDSTPEPEKKGDTLEPNAAAGDYERVVCPECGAELPADLAREPVKICPACKANISDSYEVLIRPAARSPWARRIAWIIIIGFAIVILLALVAIYR